MSVKTRAEERRVAVLRAVVAISETPIMAGDPVLPFHVRWFGIRECVEAPVDRIKADLRWLADRGYVERVPGPDQRIRGRVEYRPTDAGREWCGAVPGDRQMTQQGEGEPA